MKNLLFFFADPFFVVKFCTLYGLFSSIGHVFQSAVNVVKSVTHAVEKTIRPIVKPAIVAASVYYGGGAILAAPGGAGALGSLGAAVINGRRQSTGGPLPQENSAPYGVGGQVYTQSREPYYSPVAPSYASEFMGGGSGGGSAFNPGDPGAPQDAAPTGGMSPLLMLGLAGAGVVLLLVMLRR